MRVLITAGGVYGRLDDNKLVGNRVRGIWACRFAGHMAAVDHAVTLLVPDTINWRQVIDQIGDMARVSRNGMYEGQPGNIHVVWHTGFDDYRAKCKEFAATHDAVVLAAAVVNWIPQTPIPGKMPTKGYKVGDTVDIRFYLAPRVIEEMKAINPKLTLIGCKMLINSTEKELVDAAYDVLLKSRCNVVVANDMGHGLKRKLLVYPDRSVHEYDDDFKGLFAALQAVIEDEHFRTVRFNPSGAIDTREASVVFDQMVEEHRSRFMRFEGGRVFGAVAVTAGWTTGWLVSPREKGGMFTSKDATVISIVDYENREVRVPEGWPKPTLNAPLLIRFAAQFGHRAVLHFHEQVPGLPTLPYAPPGTVRDNMRELPPVCHTGFNIEGHGCVLPG